MGGTQLILSNCGEGDGKTYTLANGVSALLDAEGNELLLDSSNNTISHYFDTTQPGTGFWADATLSLAEDGTLQLVRHNETVKAAQTITTRQTASLVFSYYAGISFEDITQSSSSSSVYGGAIYGDGDITLSGNGRVTFSGNTASSAYASAYGGAIYGTYNSTIELSGNGRVTFSGNSASSSDGYAYGGAICGYDSTIELNSNESVTFSGNTASSSYAYGYAYGGAIDGSTIELSGNGSVTFSGNTASSSYAYGYAYGGAIDGSTITLSGNGSVTFSENTASDDGGAIYGYGTIELSGNGRVTFSGNTAYTYGGAIFGATYSTITLADNESVTFIGNSAFGSSNAWGGAIYGDGDITLSGNGSVTFIGNSASYSGGAIYGSTIELSGNDSVAFSGNTASYYGGAIDGSTITLNSNGSVTFSENTASVGGAIYGYGNSTIALSGNDSVAFSGNTASSSSDYSPAHGGAIGTFGNLSIRNNDSVLFEKNAEIHVGTYRLRSIYAGVSGVVISLSAAEGKSIEFRDSVFIGSGSTMDLNADYTDAEGVMHKQAGDIIFTGKYTEQHLNELLAADGLNRTATETEILNSRTTVVNATTNLYGGRLRVEDGAIYKGNGITVHKGSAASVLLKDAELSHSGYDITFNAGTTLELSGHNTITAAHLNMEDGSIMSFRMDKDNAAEGALTYTGNFNMGNKLVLNLNLDSNMASSGRTALMTFANGPDAGNWKAEHVVVNDLSGKGYGATELIWDGNTLYLSHAKLDDNGTADWEGGDGRWDGISGNWGQGDNMFSFTGQVDLFFGDKGSGTITIAGSFSTGDIHVNNSEGNDYHWKNDDKHAGCLHGDHSFHKEGKGDLTVDVELSYTGTTQVDGGTLTLNGSADLTGTFSNNGKLVINGSTTLGGDYEGSGDIEITGKLKLDKHDIEIGKGKDKDKADVHNNGKGNDDNIFSADNEDYEIKNGHVVAKGQNGNNGNNGLHLGNKLTDTSVENAGEETLVITHGENSLNGVHANKGNVEVYGKDKHRLQDITISGNLSVSFMTTGWEEGIDEYREAEISIFETADFESNAILIADLILESGCKLTMDGAVHMGSDVTLNLGTTLNGRLYEDALNLAHAGEYVVLFDSVDSLILNNGTTSITYAPGELTLEDGVAANIYFTNLGEDSNIYITFVPGDTPVGGGTGTTGGEIRLTLGKDSDSDAVPEPSTSILGLMGLVALSMRRRRK